MAQSGTYNFNLDIDEVIQEAMEMIGGEETLGHEPKSARRSINLMLNDWQNRGVLLWTATETKLERISFEEYHVLPNKDQIGRPTQYAVKKDIDNPTIHLYPVPNTSTGILGVEAIRQVQDANKSFNQNADAPVRFLPCLTAGLAYYMGLKRPNIPGQRLSILKQNYEELLMRAMEDNKDRASLFIKPRLRYI